MKAQIKKSVSGPSMAPLESPVCLQAKVARDLMTPNPSSIHDTATPQEAADFLYRKHISASPVIDEAGRPVGVLSLTDLVWFQRAKDGHFKSQHEFYQASKTPLSKESKAKHSKKHTVRDIMTPAVFSVPPETPASQVISEMFHSQIHRLFVVDHDGILIGVISAFDIVRDLFRRNSFNARCVPRGYFD